MHRHLVNVGFGALLLSLAPVIGRAQAVTNGSGGSWPRPNLSSRGTVLFVTARLTAFNREFHRVRSILPGPS